MKVVRAKAPTRIDLAGGTLDIPPLLKRLVKMEILPTRISETGERDEESR
jgi:hypothetical protein